MALDYGSVPQWVTALIAATAGYLAFRSIQSQRSIARRRAAFDLFLKTETDEKMITAYDHFHDGIAAMRKAPSAESFCTSEQTRKPYLSIRKYLNVHELVAVGIREEVLDPEVAIRIGVTRSPTITVTPSLYSISSQKGIRTSTRTRTCIS